jgi:hypothetical protein
MTCIPSYCIKVIVIEHVYISNSEPPVVFCESFLWSIKMHTNLLVYCDHSSA